MFILAGDIVDKLGNESRTEIFGRVRARCAKLAVLGNWEYAGNVDLVRLREFYMRADIRLLVNDGMVLDGLFIFGLDDYLCGSPSGSPADTTSSGLKTIVVVSHCPQSFEHFENRSETPAVFISGHTHGGQIAPFGWVLSTSCGNGRYAGGWYHRGNDAMYVMRGIGTTPGLPLRLGARPEVLLLDFTALTRRNTCRGALRTTVQNMSNRSQ